jgi:hypothetical protein
MPWSTATCVWPNSIMTYMGASRIPMAFINIWKYIFNLFLQEYITHILNLVFGSAVMRKIELNIFKGVLLLVWMQRTYCNKEKNWWCSRRSRESKDVYRLNRLKMYFQILMNAMGILDAPIYVIILLGHTHVAVDQGIN